MPMMKTERTGPVSNRANHTKPVLTKPSTLKKRKPKNEEPKMAANLYRKFASQEDAEQLGRQALARQRFRLAIRCIRAFVRFQMGLRPAGAKKEQTGLLENTYQMAPDTKTMFRAVDAENVVLDVLTKAFDKYTYDSSTASKMVKILSTSINDRLKMLAAEKFPRYKLVSNVLISQNVGQGFGFCSRSLWNDNTDKYVCVNHKNFSCFVTATVHAVYID